MRSFYFWGDKFIRDYAEMILILNRHQTLCLRCDVAQQKLLIVVNVLKLFPKTKHIEVVLPGMSARYTGQDTDKRKSTANFMVFSCSG